jgi:PPP family 3-phenylpropionic acid transporter
VTPLGRGGLYLRLSLFYAALFGVTGVTTPFWPRWLEAQGLDPQAIGLLLATLPWVRLLTNPWVARLADRGLGARRLLLAVAAGTVLAYALFGVATGFWALLLVSLLSGACFANIQPLAESIAVPACRAQRLDYGQVRLWGSLSFILVAAGAGWLLADRSPAWILLLTLAGLVLALAAGLGLPERRSAMPPGGAGALRLLRDRRFALFVLASGLIQSSHVVLYGFATLRWLAAGHDAGTIGWLWSEGVVIETLVFALGGRLIGRIGPLWLLAAGGAVAALRWLGLAWLEALPALAVLQALHGITFGASHLAAMSHIGQSTPPQLAATAQGLHGAIAWGAVFGLAMAAAGPLYARFGGGAFIPMAGLALAGAGLAAMLARRPPLTQSPAGSPP